MDAAFDVGDLIDRLPTPSVVALEVMRLCEDDSSDAEQLSAVLARDPALTVRVLNLANSAFYGRGRQVLTLERAALVLGLRTVKIAALSFALVDALPSSGTVGGLSLPLFWARSATSATAARDLAALAGSGQQQEAFLAGLLAEIGRLGFALALPEGYERVVASEGPWPSPFAEQAQLGMSSTDFGSLLLGTWGLPSLYVWAPLLLTGHPATSSEPDDVRQLAPVLHLAGTLTEALLGDPPANRAAVQQVADRTLGVPPPALDAELDALRVTARDAAVSLGISLPEGLRREDLIDRSRRVALRLALDAEQERRAAASEA